MHNQMTTRFFLFDKDGSLLLIARAVGGRHSTDYWWMIIWVTRSPTWVEDKFHLLLVLPEAGMKLV